jgi:hypothetical protein
MRFRSPLLSQSRFLSFPPGTEMVHFPGFARTRLWIHRAVRGFYPRGFPHSEIPGSKPACGSPRLIAACHVLHRRLLPRHPPCALSSLTTKFTRCTAATLGALTDDCFQLSVIGSQLRHYTPCKLYSATLLLARLDMFSCSANCKIPRFRRDDNLGKNVNRLKKSYVHQQVLRHS